MLARPVLHGSKICRADFTDTYFNNTIKTFGRIGPNLLEDLLAYFEADRQIDLKREVWIDKPLRKELNVYENKLSKQWPSPMIHRM